MENKCIDWEKMREEIKRSVDKMQYLVYNLK